MKKLYFSLFISFCIVFNLSGQQTQRLPADQLEQKLINSTIITGDELSNKINPLLKMLILSVTSLKATNEYSKNDLEHFNKFIQVNEGLLTETSVPVFIKSTDIEFTKSKIYSAGGIVYTVIEDIITAELPVSVIHQFILASETIYIDGSYMREPLINVSRVQTKVNQLHDGTGISRPYKGNNVVVGVLDTGIDWQHLDFKNAGGSRIRFLWDMFGQGNPPSGYNYGTEFTKTQIDANQCTETDVQAHGTHVAGTAAGNGGANSQYIGMAPESDMIIVKAADTGGFTDANVVNGCNFIFQKAQQLGKPAVINLSLGGQYGPHDGTSLYEQTLSGLTGPGKIIVAAAGNAGADNVHLSYTASGTAYNDSYETYWLLPENASWSGVDMWYNTGNISVGIAAYDMTSFQLIGYTSAVAPGQQVQDQPFLVNGTTYGWFTIDATNSNDPNNGGKEVFIALDNHNGQANLNSVLWSVYTFGSGTFDAWNLGGIFSDYTSQWFKPGDSNKSIGVPGTSAKLLCIGSYVTKTSWVDLNGTTQFQSGNPVIGQISYFSSLGPTRDNRIKPDFVAPGEVIIAALSSNSSAPPEWILLGGKLRKMQGTSMAAPHVTGVIALLLEKNPTLNYEQVVNILNTTAVKDNFTGSTQNNTYGHGKMDAYNAFLNIGGGGTQVTLLQQGFDQTFPPSGWTTTVLNQSYTWLQGNPQNNNFNQIDPSSTNSALCPWVAQNQNEWLITPSFNLGNGNASIEFYAGYSTEWLSGATLKLHITTDGGSNWTQIWTADNDGQAWMWRNKVVDISSYSNKQNLKLGWQYVGNDGDMVALDGVKLLGFPTSIEEIDSEIPDEFELSFNYPNPFNPSTKFRYALPEGREVKIIIYDLLGTKVTELVNNFQNAGTYEISWNGKNDLNQQVASGTYFFTVIAGDFVQTKKMLMVK